MSFDPAIRVEHISKCYQIYDTPGDRLKQFILPRFHQVLSPLGRKALLSYYHEFWALQDVSFDVRRGQTVGIIGRNGSGKSTLLQMICGTLAPSSGSIQTRGRVAALLELGSGFNPEFTGRENVYLNASVLGLSRQQTDERFADIVAFADIGPFIDQPVKMYSSGMMVRLAFAVIAHVDADILVIDEALAVGDAFFTQKCMRYLRRFMKTGTVLFVSHDTGSVRNLCTEAIWLEKGRILQQGPPKEVCENYLEAFYEAQQGKSTTTRIKKIKRDEEGRIPFKDQRASFINASNLRNDLQLFDFDPEAPSFGKGAAQITSVKFFDANGAILSWIVGGEDVILRVQVLAHQPLQSPIIGFYVKDRLGQCLFGDNTWLSHMDHTVACEAGRYLEAAFAFEMPRLQTGNYSITVAVAEGDQDDHVQHHWIHDAVFFKSESTSVAAGLIGIPMKEIKLDVKDI
ncbi:MAG: ABC transporter ATP-binding protein [Gammaproteobacteria bacterium]|nr:ABC transporter ATP-binding protein [Gammaproteobacteria bacterium]